MSYGWFPSRFGKRVLLGDVAPAWRPHDDERSPVRMNPELRFGRPAIKGISTEVLWEHAESGEDVEETAEPFGLEPDDMRWTLDGRVGQLLAGLEVDHSEITVDLDSADAALPA